MSRKAIKSNLFLNDTVIGLVNESVADLLSTHAGKIVENLEESDGKKTTVGLSLEIDCSESAPSIDVKIRFSSAVTDRRHIGCDDPNQEHFSIMTPEELRKQRELKKENESSEKSDGDKPEKKKRAPRKSAKAKAEDAAAAAGEAAASD